MAERTPSRLAASWSTSGSSSTESTRSGGRRVEHLAGLRAAGPRGACRRRRTLHRPRRRHRQRVALRQSIRRGARGWSPEPPRHEGEQRPRARSRRERRSDLVQRLQLAEPSGRGFVQARVLDGERQPARPGAAHSSSSSVSRARRSPSRSGRSTRRRRHEQDRHAEERPRSRMVRGSRRSVGRRRWRAGRRVRSSRIGT